VWWYWHPPLLDDLLMLFFLLTVSHPKRTGMSEWYFKLAANSSMNSIVIQKNRPAL